MRLNSNDVVLFSGDSITHGNRGQCMDCNHILGHGYQYIAAGRLALDNLDTRPKFINKGYSGFTMGQLLEKWQEDVIANKPTYLSVLAGVNDGHQGCLNGLTVQEVADRYRSTLCGALDLTLAANPETKLIICEPFYFPLEQTGSYALTPHPYCEGPFRRPDEGEPAAQREFREEAMHLTREAARETAERYRAVFVPFYEPLKAAMARSCPEYFIWDGTHPTVAGHMLMADEWLRAVETIGR